MIRAQLHTFLEIDHLIISMVILLYSAESFKKGCCQLQAKVCARSTTLQPAYLSCEFAFHVRFQRIVRALSLNCVWNANQRISKLMNIYYQSSNAFQR